ncbi:MAG: methyltransferase domain-containing protein [Myxococcales bacterium]|nr:methyltransferase domain-containing protein [Myxococcales bacterium]
MTTLQRDPSGPTREDGLSFDELSDIHLQIGQWNDFTASGLGHQGVQQAENVDPFARITQCSAEEIELIAHILELRGAQPCQAKMRRSCLEAAGIAKGMSVLEVGCGTGVIARDIARVVGETGRLVAVDPSERLLDYARSRPPMHGETPIEWVPGFADSLPFAAGTFDVGLAVTLMSHLTQQHAALIELRRVTKPGGKLMLFDQDYETLVFEHSNKEITRRILRHGADYNIVDGWCGRRLPGILAEVGVQQIKCWPFVYSERNAGSYLITIAERFAKLARRHGIITREEHRGWIGELHDRATEGTFYASLNYYFAFGIV